MTNQVVDPNALIMGTGARSASFKNHGDRVWGTIISSEVRQQTDFDTSQLLFWDDGKPRLQVVITVQTDISDDDDDDGLRAIYAKGQMLKAIGDACRKAGAKGISEGGRLLVQYVSDAEPKRRGMSGAKQYFAKYEPPVTMVEIPDQPDEDELPF